MGRHRKTTCIGNQRRRMQGLRAPYNRCKQRELNGSTGCAFVSYSGQLTEEATHAQSDSKEMWGPGDQSGDPLS